MEEKEIDLMLGNLGILTTTKLFGRKKEWKLGKMSLHRLLQLTKVYVKLNIDAEDLQTEDVSEQMTVLFTAVLDNAYLSAKILSVAVDSRYPNWFVRRHLSRNVDAKELEKIVYRILKESNLANFSTSIILMSLMKTTKPRMMEKKKKVEES